MKTIASLLVMAATLAGCIVVPAGRGHYHSRPEYAYPRPPVYYYPAPRYYRY